VVSNLIALVIGGYVAARLSGMPRGDGIIHGLLTWAVTPLITITFDQSIGTIVGGVQRCRQHARPRPGVAEAVPEAPMARACRQHPAAGRGTPASRSSPAS
jgi:hypothetical protein